MRLLADENFPDPAILALERAGHDIVSVSYRAPSLSDTDVFAWAVREDRILLTFDKHFGDISRRTIASAYCGVILFRHSMPMLARTGQYFADLIAARSDWAGHLSVVDANGVRQRLLRLR